MSCFPFVFEGLFYDKIGAQGPVTLLEIIINVFIGNFGLQYRIFIFQNIVWLNISRGYFRGAKFPIGVIVYYCICSTTAQSIKVLWFRYSTCMMVDIHVTKTENFKSKLLFNMIGCMLIGCTKNINLLIMSIMFTMILLISYVLT